MRRVTATYRLQLNVGFTFADAQARVAYLAALGVSHLYLSPIFAARSGSQHGYDVVDPTMISPELGGEAGFRDLAAAARQAGLGIVLDIVPNHMATDSANPAWMAVLEHGRAAPSARLFDIDWSQDRILLPVLGGALDEVLARGEIAIETEAGTGRRVARYFDQAFPLRPDGPDAGTAARRPPRRAALAARRLAAGGARADLSALLQHHRPDRRARRGPGGVRACASPAPGAPEARASSTG